MEVRVRLRHEMLKRMHEVFPKETRGEKRVDVHCGAEQERL